MAIEIDQSFLQLLTLIIVANATPIILRDLLGSRWSVPVDAGSRLADGQPVLGSSKTWRGIVGAAIATAIVAVLLDVPVFTGVMIGLLAMLGDLIASFIKRRLAMEPSSMALLLDQLPEALLPGLVFRQAFGLSPLSLIVLLLVFVLFELVISAVLYQIGIRKRPY